MTGVGSTPCSSTTCTAEVAGQRSSLGVGQVELTI